MPTYNKLVRDKIPEILDKKGVLYEKKIASEDEYRFELMKKLAEEVTEFSEAKNSEELADIIEVIESLKKLPEFNDTESVRQNKRQEKGGFDSRIILKGTKD